MNTVTVLDSSNRIVLTKDLRRASGFDRNEALKISAAPGRIVIEREPASSGRVERRGKWRVWTGDIPATPIEDAVDLVRHYTR